LVLDLNLGAQPQLGAFRLQPGAIQHREQEAAEVGRVCLKRRCRVGLCRLEAESRSSELVVRIRPVHIKARIPDEPRLGHRERLKDQLFDENVRQLSGDRFDGLLKIKEAFAGVAKSIAGREMGLQRPLGISPVWQTRRVAEHLAWGDRGCPVVT